MGFQDVIVEKVNILYWDIMVVNDGEFINGWVWLCNWVFCIFQVDGIIQLECVWDCEFNGIFYFYIIDGFVLCINFENVGMQGLLFNVVFNCIGFGNSGVLIEDCKLVFGINVMFNFVQY